MDVHGYIDDIKKRIKGKKVLDIGCLGSYERSLLLRHNEWRKTAAEVIGIDNNIVFLEEVQKKYGHLNIRYCDITDKRQVEILVEEIGRFQHIIATDIIEHIGNLTSFLNNTKLFMADRAIIYLTTSNVRSLTWQGMWDGKMEFLFNDDHICWFDIDTLRSLLKRSGLKIRAIRYCGNKVDKELAEEHNIEWQPNLSRRIYLHVGKA